MLKINNIKRGFTLIELLVVISIIGLLSSIVLAALGSAKAKANDARRASDIHAIQLALELYYNDNGKYPTSGCSASCAPGPVPSVWSTSNNPASNVTGYNSSLQAALAPYISKLPHDPKEVPYVTAGNWPASANQYAYTYYSNAGCNQGYMLVWQLEINSGTNPGAGQSYCSYPASNITYAFTRVYIENK